MRSLAWACIGLIALPAALLVVNTLALGQGDTDPPHLASFDFQPKAVNTSSSSQTITFTARITDDLSGLAYAQIQFNSPSDSQHLWVGFNEYNRVSGSSVDGVYVALPTLPQYSEAGTWQLAPTFPIQDNVGNLKWMRRADFILAGLPTEILVRVGHVRPHDLYLPIISRD